MADKWIECYYGESGTGKSESAAAVIRRIYKETGKKSRVLVGDGSSATYSALVQAGVVEMADYTIRDWPLSTLKQYLEGWWPVDALDPKSPFKIIPPDVLKNIGVYVIEGLTVASGYVMGDKRGGFAERAGRGEKIGQDSPIQIIDQLRDAAGNPIKDSGPGTVFGGNPLAHFQHAQKRMLGFIETSKGLPADWVIWTAHQRSAEDKVTAQKLIGPEVAGGALTAGLSKYFNNTLHFATVEKTAKATDEHMNKQVDVVDAEYRIYTRDHFRPEGGVYVKYKAVTRHPDPNGKQFGTALPLYFENDNPGTSILDFYENIAKARLGQIASLQPAAC